MCARARHRHHRTAHQTIHFNDVVESSLLFHAYLVKVNSLSTRTTYSTATKASALALAAGLCIAGLTACNDNDTTAAPSTSEATTTTITETSTTTVAPDESTESSAPQSSNSESPAGASTSEAEAIALAAAETTFGSGSWVVSDSSEYDPDSDMSYILLDNNDLRVDLRVALFHKGSFQEFAGDDRVAIAGATADPTGVRVSFVDSAAFRASGEPLANRYAFTKEVVYYWNGDHVSYEGEMPAPPELP